VDERHRPCWRRYRLRVGGPQYGWSPRPSDESLPVVGNAEDEGVDDGWPRGRGYWQLTLVHELARHRLRARLVRSFLLGCRRRCQTLSNEVEWVLAGVDCGAF
jgi:hypothetical protein